MKNTILLVGLWPQVELPVTLDVSISICLKADRYRHPIGRNPTLSDKYACHARACGLQSGIHVSKRFLHNQLLKIQYGREPL